MGRLLNGCLVLLTTTAGMSLPVSAPAAWATHVATGQTCSLISWPWAGKQFGYVSGWTATATEPGSTIAIRCTIQVGATGATHAGADAAAASSVPGQTTTLPYTAFSFDAVPSADLFLCTEWTVTDSLGTTTYYHDAAFPGFSTSPIASCALLVGVNDIYVTWPSPTDI